MNDPSVGYWMYSKHSKHSSERAIEEEAVGLFSKLSVCRCPCVRLFVRVLLCLSSVLTVAAAVHVLLFHCRPATP